MFANKVVLVAGASSGIGAKTAILFAKEQASVVIVGRNENKLKNVEETCKEYKADPFVIKADVSNDEEAKGIIDKTVEKFGKIDVLVNNAGLARYGSVLDGRVLEAYDGLMNTNVRAVINLTMLAAPHLIASKGNIVNVSSMAAMTTPSSPTYLSYYVSKAALDHFTRGVALELAPSGVRVNSVNPGLVRTDILENSGINNLQWDDMKGRTALGRIGEPEEIADVIAFLASDKARSVTGSSYVSDNGMLLSKVKN